jgi:preflagellin peptidase FlaK
MLFISLAVRLYRGDYSLTLSLISISIALVIAILTSVSGMMGGADAKAILLIAVGVPLRPESLPPLLMDLGFIPLSTVFNSVIFSSLMALYAIVRNLTFKLKGKMSLFEGFEREGILRKASAFISGFKVSLRSIEEAKFLYPIEDLELNGKLIRRIRPMMRFEKGEDVIRKLMEAYRKGLIGEYIWVTPGIPMLPFILAGFLASLFLGDIALSLVFKLLSPLL